MASVKKKSIIQPTMFLFSSAKYSSKISSSLNKSYLLLKLLIKPLSNDNKKINNTNLRFEHFQELRQKIHQKLEKLERGISSSLRLLLICEWKKLFPSDREQRSEQLRNLQLKLWWWSQSNQRQLTKNEKWKFIKVSMKRIRGMEKGGVLFFLTFNYNWFYTLLMWTRTY